MGKKSMDGRDMDKREIPHFTSLDSAMEALFGSRITIKSRQRVSGGDINEAYGLLLSDGSQVFMKSNRGKGDGFFAAEAAGISAIARTNTIGTPRILCTGRDGGDAFLLMEFVREGKRISDYWRVFGQELAAMHQADTAGLVAQGEYGFLEDNFIGERRQANTARHSWISFFRDCRLRPQLENAASYFDREEREKAERLLGRLEEILVEPERPSLLHGDLWSGNFITGSDGKAWLIDPAVSVGHAEADLAMTELFGGFSPAFYQAYREAFPMQPGYEYRREVYNLYHLLNHLNMFGRAYLPSVRRIIEKYSA